MNIKMQILELEYIIKIKYTSNVQKDMFKQNGAGNGE